MQLSHPPGPPVLYGATVGHGSPQCVRPSPGDLAQHAGDVQCALGSRQALQMPERQVRVESVPIGGGFGGKETLLEPLAAAVASRLRKPVQLIYTRQEDLLAGNPAPQTVITIKLGAKRDGTLTAIQARMIFDSGAYPNPLAGFS